MAIINLIVGVYSLVTNGWRSGAKVTINGSVLTTDYSGRVTFSTSTNTLHTIKAELDGHITQTKLFTTGDTSVETDIYLSGAGVDIRATNIAVNPASIVMGDKFDIIVTYTNYGSTGTQYKNIYSGNVIIGNKDVNVNAGESRTETYNYLTGACPQLCAGVHTIKCDNQAITLTIKQSELFKDVWVNPSVKDKITFAPIGGATVTIGTDSRITDAQGKTTTFKLEINVPYTMKVVASGYMDVVSLIQFPTAITFDKLIQMERGITEDPKVPKDKTFYYILLAVVVIMILMILIRRS